MGGGIGAGGGRESLGLLDLTGDEDSKVVGGVLVSDSSECEGAVRG